MIYDINLIPKSKAKSSGGFNAILLTVTAITAIALLLFGYYFPHQQKLHLRNRIENQEKALMASADAEEAFTSLKDRIQEINAADSMMDAIKSNSIRLTDMLSGIENSIPEDVVIQSITMEAGLLTIDGVTPGYTQIAAFIVNLRKQDKVLGVTLLGTRNDTSLANTNPKQDEASGETFEFTLYANYSYADVFDELAAFGEALANTEGTEAVPSEAD